MAIDPQAHTRLLFGPFEFDSEAGELLREGLRIRLPRQPRQILLELLTHAGHVVGREQLRQQIWTDQTFVDFEHGLNVAMNRLRRALNDSAESPRYVETIPGVGYRFIGTVQEISAPGPGPRINQNGAPIASDEPRASGRNRKNAWVAASAAGLVMLAIVGSALWRLHRGPALTGKDTIVVADFVNKTGDGVFDDTLRQALTVDLEQSPFLSLVSDDRIRTTLQLMGSRGDARLSRETARQVCERVGGAAVLEGSIARLGNQYALWLRAENCRNGDVLDDEQGQASRKEDVLAALDRMVAGFRARAGESLAAVREHSVPLAEATTPSMEALQAYTEGRRVAFASGYASAVPHFRRALEVDPQFAMAHASLGRMYADIGETVQSSAEATRAWELRERASERERFYISFTYDRQVTGNLEKAQRTLQSWAQSYPRDSDALALLSGFATKGVGQFERSIDAARKAIANDPDCAPCYENLAESSLALNRVADAEAALRRASERGLEIADYAIFRFYLAFLKHDETAMLRETRRASAEPGAQDWMAHTEAMTLAHRGRLREARAMSRRAVAFSDQVGDRERTAIYEAGAAVYEAFSGNSRDAQMRARAALQLSKGRDVEYGAAVAMALSGGGAAADGLAADLQRRFPEDTFVRFDYVPTLRAFSALARGAPDDAVEELRISLPYETGLPGSRVVGFFGALYAAWARGEAFLAMHDGAQAAIEFRKILDHPGLVLADPTAALAHAELGRALALAGRVSEAKAAYQDFFALWQAADQEVPALRRVKSEYARLP